MSFRSCLNTIINTILIATSGFTLNGQDARLDRLHLQYRYMNEKDPQKKDLLAFEVADAFLSENDTWPALELAATIDSTLPAHAALIRGKAHFMEDDFRASRDIMGRIDTAGQTPKFNAEVAFYRILNLHHLLLPDSACALLTGFISAAGGDTTGIRSFYSQMTPPKQYSLKKAVNRSFIPGGGLFYVEEPGKAVSSILLQAGFAGYAVYSTYSRHYITAALTGVSQFMRFYGGGRRAARNIGLRKNRQRYIAYVLKADRYSEIKIFGM